MAYLPPLSISATVVLTAVKTNLTAVKVRRCSRPPLTAASNKANICMLHKVQIHTTGFLSRDCRMPSKVRNPTKYIQSTFSKVQIRVPPTKYIQRTLSKVQISVSSPKYIQRTLTKVQISVSSSREQSMIEQDKTKQSRNPITPKSRNTATPPKTTPYGPHNLPHMVLCTKQGTDNA